MCYGGEEKNNYVGVFLLNQEVNRPQYFDFERFGLRHFIKDLELLLASNRLVTVRVGASCREALLGENWVYQRDSSRDNGDRDESKCLIANLIKIIINYPFDSYSL